MVLLAVLVLGSMFILGCFALWRAQMLFTHRAADFLKSNYGVVDPARVGPASKLLGCIFVIWGLWLLVAPVLVFTLSIPFSSWGGLLALGIGFQYLAGRMVKRRYGHQHS